MLITWSNLCLTLVQVEQPEPTVTRKEGVPSQEVLMSLATSGSAQDVAEELDLTSYKCPASQSFRTGAAHLPHPRCAGALAQRR